MLQKCRHPQLFDVGALGYELNIPSEQATHVYDLIVEAGKNFGLRHAGLKALASLRMKMGYRDYGHDMDNTDDPYEVGLGFAVRLCANPDRLQLLSQPPLSELPGQRRSALAASPASSCRCGCSRGCFDGCSWISSAPLTTSAICSSSARTRT
jgi:hypothetical protein